MAGSKTTKDLLKGGFRDNTSRKEYEPVMERFKKMDHEKAEAIYQKMLKIGVMNRTRKQNMELYWAWRRMNDEL